MERAKCGKRILIATQRYPVGHSFLEEVYIRIMPRRGWEVTWMLTQPKADAPFEERDLSGTKALVYPRRRNRLLNQVNFARNLKSLILSGGFDVVQARGDWSTDIPVLWTGRRAAHGIGIPFVQQVSFPLWFSAARKARERDSWRKYSHILETELRIALVHKLRRKADWIFPISEYMKDELAGFGCDPERMTPLPLGFDCSIRPEDADDPGICERLGIRGRPVALYFGMMDPIRDLDVLIRAFAISLRAAPSALLIMLGGGNNPPERERLKRLAAELGIVDSVVFKDDVPRGEAFSYIRASDFTVSPYPPSNIWNTASPTKMVESLAMGRAVVGSNIPDIAKMLGESGAGICAPYEESAFADAMTRLFTDRNLCAELGGRGRDYIEKHRDYNKMADTIEEIYGRLMREKAGRVR